ncbi:MAG: helix-turn-helix domain-containing protein [Gammaproteobacteria bacterium]|nr:helix-turn-helix domain-containing protein [Gammaproteobacteria bacterium]
MSTKSKFTDKTLKKLERFTDGPLTLGKLIWSIRVSDEMTQVEFSALLGMSKQHLCDIEHDRKVVSPKLAAEYANKLGCSEHQFVRLALQGMLDRAGLNFEVELKQAA